MADGWIRSSISSRVFSRIDTSFLVCSDLLILVISSSILLEIAIQVAIVFFGNAAFQVTKICRARPSEMVCLNKIGVVLY
jgi:hypothetical protein